MKLQYDPSVMVDNDRPEHRSAGEAFQRWILLSMCPKEEEEEEKKLHQREEGVFVGFRRRLHQLAYREEQDYI